MGYTTPQFSAFKSVTEENAWAMQWQVDANQSVDAVGIIHAQAHVVGQLAFENSNKTGQHMSTAVVARDMLSIVKAHGREKLLYWGFS